jgi:hypothetical protein
MAFFEPEPPPETDNVQELKRYCYDMFRLVANAIELLETGRFDVQYAAPAKAREGTLAFADGTQWNPGSGKGFYEYRSGAWVKL